MPELTYILAILIRKDIVTVSEASSLLKASKEGTMNGMLGEMVTKVDGALKKKADTLEKIDARSIM